MLLYSNTYNYSQPNAAPGQGSQNPFEYYNDPNANSYVYISLEQLIGNFMANNVGDHLVLNNVTRYQVIYQFKQALKQFTFDALNEVRAIELELGDTLQITLPPDYVNYVRISWLNRQTGEFHPLSVNRNVNPFVQGYLQDHNWNILFDSEGYPLEGTSLTETVNDSLPHNTLENCNQYSLACGGGCITCHCGRPNVWNFDTTKNYNGTFNIDNRNKKIHFSSDNLSRVIILEYISDGLEYADSDDVKINKLAETALIATVYAELLEMQLGVPEYAKQSARKKANTLFRNAKIKCANIKIPQIAEIMRGRKKWIN